MNNEGVQIKERDVNRSSLVPESDATDLGILCSLSGMFIFHKDFLVCALKGNLKVKKSRTQLIIKIQIKRQVLRYSLRGLSLQVF